MRRNIAKETGIAKSTAYRVYVAQDLSGPGSTVICPVIDLLEVEMRRTEQRQGLRMLKLRDVLSRREAGWLSQIEAAELKRHSGRPRR